MERLTQRSYGNLIEVPLEHLHDRVKFLTDELKDADRMFGYKQIIERELSHLALELWCREQERKNEIF